MDQEKFCFGRTMEPCDYEAPLAQVLGENECVVVKAYNGRNKEKKKNSKEELSK